MASHDYVIANGTGSAVRADLNNALAAIVSNNSSSSEPATKYAYQWWADTTTGQLKLRNAANNGWVTIFELDGTMLMEDGTVSAPGLAFASDLNTGFFRSAADKINFATGGVERLEIGSSEVVFNDGSNDVDFRVESNGQTHMLFVDGGNDRVGIGTSSPTTTVDVNASQAFLQLKSTGGTNSAGIQLVPGGQSQAFYIYNNGSRNLIFEDHATERLRIDSSGRLLCGTSTSPTAGNGQYANIVIQGYPGTSAGAGHISLQRGQAAFGANNQIGLINFGDNTGASYAGIECYADADSGTNDYPGRLVFATTSDAASSPTERLRITSGGFVGIGTSSPDMRLDVTGSVSAGGGSDEDLQQWNIGSDNVKAEIKYIDTSADRGMRFGTSTAHTLGLQSNNTERIRLDSAGVTYIQNSSATTQLRIGTLDEVSFEDREHAIKIYGHSANDYVIVRGCNDADGTPVFDSYVSGSRQIEIEADGSVNSQGAYTNISDQRLKENIVDSSSQWDDVKALRVRNFNFTEASGYPTATKIGFIAQEVEQVSPGLVKTRYSYDEEGQQIADSDTKLVKTTVITTKAFKALQEAMARIETLETKVASLEASS